MKKVQRRPYLTPLRDRVVIDHWEQQLDDRTMPLGDRLPGWDAGSDIRVRADLFVNVEGIFQDCRLERDAVLRLVLIWESELSCAETENLLTLPSMFNLDVLRSLLKLMASFWQTP
jgi:hypothetical protein